MPIVKWLSIWLLFSFFFIILIKKIKYGIRDQGAEPSDSGGSL